MRSARDGLDARRLQVREDPGIGETRHRDDLPLHSGGVGGPLRHARQARSHLAAGAEDDDVALEASEGLDDAGGGRAERVFQPADVGNPFHSIPLRGVPRRYPGGPNGVKGACARRARAWQGSDLRGQPPCFRSRAALTAGLFLQLTPILVQSLEINSYLSAAAARACFSGSSWRASLRLLRLFQEPSCQAQLAIRGRTVVASA